MPRRAVGRWIVAALLVAAGAVLAGGPAAGVAQAAEVATFGTPTVTGVFGQDITFRQPVTLTEPIERAELLVSFADALGPQVFDVVPPAARGTGELTLEHTIRIADQGHILPNTPMVARWRLTPRGDPTTPAIGPEVRHVYADEGHDWRTTEGKLVRVHWYEGNEAFGERALRIGEDAIESSAALLGVTMTEPIDFFIYADEDAFRAALGPGTRENVGGQANSDIQTLFALIPAGQIDDAWVRAVVPHELTHLVFHAASDNPYHEPPHWLNEGVAVYESEGYGPSDRSDVSAAASGGDLIPLPGLNGQFPTSGERFRLAYAESVSAVDYLIRSHGQDALVGLIKSFADGRTDDEAFTAATGQDLSGFSDAWLADNHATAPVKAGPQPAPAGPLPSGWTGPRPTTQVGQASPAAGSSSGAAPAASAPAAASGGSDDGSSSGPLLAIVLLVIGLTIGGVVLARRRQGSAA